MRVYVMYGLILAAMCASTRRWIVGVCGVIVLAALSKHEDMPRSIAGITGFNPSNVLLGWTLLMFMRQHGRIPTVAKRLPTFAVVLVAMYAMTIVLAYLQGVIDLRSLQGPMALTGLASINGFTIEFLVNPFKVVLPAWLLYLGMRTQKDLWMVLAALSVMALILAFVVLKNLPVGTLSDEAAYMSRRHRIQQQTGLHANDLALVMMQATWATAIFLRLQMRPLIKVVAVGCMTVFGLAGALCHSRGGFLSFIVTGLVLGITCWKRMLIVFPVVMLAVSIAFPTIPARIMTGVGVQDVSGSEIQDWESISAGRTTGLWPPTVAQIGKAPVVGSGRLAILRTEMFRKIEENTGDECPSHPHNAYLEMLCDGGAASLFVFLAGMIGLASAAFSMSRRKDNTIIAFVGGLGLVAVVPLMVMGISGQSFWPRENVFPTACLIAVLLRGWTLLPTLSRPAALVADSR